MQRRNAARLGWYWLLVVPYLVMLWAPSFNSLQPALAGIPFFYWYQFVWIALTAVIIWIVYLLAHGGGRR
ncbi:MAG TPA: DUF3311 domain-containing protein [Candidatus Acidoferrales bacterium]|nr:DUF3311 domain-containing protein [Candidatus Acidoferrales bacterium]